MRTREHRQKHVDGCHARRMKLRYACGEANEGQNRLFRQGARYQFHVTNFGHVGPECHALGPTILAHGGFGGSGAESGVCSADGKHKRRANTVVE